MHHLLKRMEESLLREIEAEERREDKTLRGYAARFLRFVYVFAKGLAEEALALRAMGLVYTTLLAIVPLLAVSFSVLKAFGVHTQFEIFLYYFLEPMGPTGVDLSMKIIGLVENVKVGVLGSIGLSLLIYTVISQIQKIESALNNMWNVKDTRSFSRRFSNYTSVLLIGPVLIFSAIGLSAVLMKSTVVQALQAIELVGLIMYAFGRMLPYLLASLAFTLIYVFLPNTKVHFRSALVGGIFAGVLWKVIGVLFASFVMTSAKYSAIYSGFSLLVLFLIWLYWSWFILLAGARVSYYHQNPGTLLLAGERPSMGNRLRERLALAVMFLVGDNFHRNLPPWTIDSLAARLCVPASFVHETVSVFEERGLLAAVGDEPSYLPARDLDTISLSDILAPVRGESGTGIPLEQAFSSPAEVEVAVNRVEEAIDRALQGNTLRGLVGAGSAEVK